MLLSTCNLYHACRPDTSSFCFCNYLKDHLAYSKNVLCYGYPLTGSRLIEWQYSVLRQDCRSAVWSPPVPVGECHHDVQWCQEQHEVEERVGVGDTILLVVHSSVETTAFLKAVSLRPILDKSWLITGQSQLVHLGVGRITNTDGRTWEKREHREQQHERCHFKHQLTVSLQFDDCTDI